MVAHTVLYWLATQGTEGGIGGVPWNEALSNIAGSASIVCWFIVFTPQFWINYKRQSGESLSLVFLYIWLAGDIMNLVGAIMENLLLTMRVLAWYYTIADIALIAQVFYYRRTSIKATFEEAVITHPEILQTPSHPPPSYHTIDERTALLGPGASASSTGGYTAVTIPSSTAIQPADPQHHIHDNEHDQAIHDAAMKAKTAKHAHHHHHAASTPTTESSFASSRERRSSSASALTSTSAHYRAKKLQQRRRVRKALLILLPIVATLFFVWAYHDWLQCTIEGDRGGDQDSERCGRGQNGGHGKLPPPRSPSPGESDDGGLTTASLLHGDDSTGDNGGGSHRDLIALLMGWGSAILYLGSRIPQIYKNWRLKSCEGLSIMMFMFSVFGNIFYVASIFLYSVEYDYIITNMPWWLGSGGTLVFDFTIFFQFYKYRNNHPLEEALKDAVAAGELDADDILPEDDDADVENHGHPHVEDQRGSKQRRERDLEAGLGRSIKTSSASTSSASTLGVLQAHTPAPTVASPAAPTSSQSATTTTTTTTTTATSSNAMNKAKETTPIAATWDEHHTTGTSSSQPYHMEPAITTPEIMVIEDVVSRDMPAPTPAPAPVEPLRTATPPPKSVEAPSQPPEQQPQQPASSSSSPPPPPPPPEMPAPTSTAPAASPAPAVQTETTATSVPEPPSTPPPPAEPSSPAPEAPSPSTPSNKNKNKKKKKKSNKKK